MAGASDGDRQPGNCTIGVSLRRWLAGRTRPRGARALPPALLGQYGADVNGLSDVFPPRPGQVGVISAVGQDLFLELFGDPEIFEDRYDQVLKSALVEAVAHPTAVVTPTDHAQGMLGDLVLASKDSKVVQSRSLQDSGRSLVFSSGGISGSALLSGGRPVHLSAHKRCWGYGRPFDEQAPAPRLPQVRPPPRRPACNAPRTASCTVLRTTATQSPQRLPLASLAGAPNPLDALRRSDLTPDASLMPFPPASASA